MLLAYRNISNYEDTLRRNEIETLRKTGDVQLLANKEDEFAAKVKIKNRTNSDYASGKVLQKTDNILYKGVSQKDNDDRDCFITLFIYYSDSLKSNEAEYMKIVNTFPHNPFQYHKHSKQRCQSYVFCKIRKFTPSKTAK